MCEKCGNPNCKPLTPEEKAFGDAYLAFINSAKTREEFEGRLAFMLELLGQTVGFLPVGIQPDFVQMFLNGVRYGCETQGITIKTEIIDLSKLLRMSGEDNGSGGETVH